MDWMINAILLLGTLLGVAFMLVVLVAVIETADKQRTTRKKAVKNEKERAGR